MAQAILDLEDLGLPQGGVILLEHHMKTLNAGDKLQVIGNDLALSVHLRAWARAAGHGFTPLDRGGQIIRSSHDGASKSSAQYAGSPNPQNLQAVAPACWGFAARGALVDASVPPIPFRLHERDKIWTDEAPRMYAQALAAQWDPQSAIPWDSPIELPDEVEDALVQVLTYLIENETAALIVPARFLGQVHPYFREIMQILAIQVADEARHIEVFSRRAALKRPQLALSTRGGQESLKTLLEESDFALASFLLSVLGEGSFLQLLWFLFEHAPDPVTREIMKLAAADEARHVAFGLSHLQNHVKADPSLRTRLRGAIERRHESLAKSDGLNAEVFKSLVILAAGSWNPKAIAQGFALVEELKIEMFETRRQYLLKLGFDEDEAQELSNLHTRNFM